MFERYFPREMLDEFSKFDSIQEIRVRADCAVLVTDSQKTHVTQHKTSCELVQKIFTSVCSNSVYALKEQIKQGFITIPGGHRVGICGRCVCDKGEIETITDISSLNFRVAREVLNCAAPILKKVNNMAENIVIISPPNSGKTTYLRDLCRLYALRGFMVAIVDERGELAPQVKGKSVFSFGKGVDVLQYAPKAQGMMLALRTMNPHIVATDEIGSDGEGHAVAEIAKCGVRIIATFHGANLDDFKRRFEMWHVFKYAVLLNREKKPEAFICLNG
ncbi:MAG: stage III sporulation protein AA [Clostridia bacterium]|nr:stage III sporulation protein AA [Clostridia bacterium]